MKYRCIKYALNIKSKRHGQKVIFKEKIFKNMAKTGS